MSNKSLIPAFRAEVGDWQYFLCMMKYAEVARSIQFAYELGGNKDLTTMIQRGISERTNEIREYLLHNEHRFLGSLVVAAVGGHPEYIAVEMVDSEGLLSGVDREFGVLTFDGSHQFFALDGQHRLRAIKDAIIKDPDLASEDIGVIVVPHYDNAEGRQRTRRLFTNINRNAKPTSVSENIALDEDDGFAIETRRFLEDHPWLSKPGVVTVFRKLGDSGELALAGRNVRVTSPSWTSINVLYDILFELGFGLDASMNEKTRRATDQVLDDSYEKLTKRLDQLIVACGDVRSKMEAAKSIRDLRAPKNREGDGHPFMRPVVQVTVARAVNHLIEQGQLTWDEALNRLSELDWRLSEPPWVSVFVEGKGTMAAGKQFTDLLYRLLLVHLAPRNKAEIHRAVLDFKALKGAKRYPATEDELGARILTSPAGTDQNPATP